ncbi:MAG: endonuclease/exonuclease/phosphatase family protein [Planctomycetota bacterium]
MNRANASLSRIALGLTLSASCAGVAAAQMSPEEAKEIMRRQTEAARVAKAQAQDDPTDAPAGPSTTLRIASWNIEWLGTPDQRRGAGRGRAQDPRLLAACLAVARPDLIAFQEVRADGSLDEDPDRESPEVAQLLAHLADLRGGDWDHLFFPAHSEPHRTGLAWNTEKLAPIGEWRQLHKDLAGPDWKNKPEPWSAGPRPPHGLMFSAGPGRTDFVVIPIHWKSGGDDANLKRRTDEAVELLTALPRIFSDPDVIIIGDSNCFSTNDPPIQHLKQAGFRDLNFRENATMAEGRSPIDRAFVPAAQPEFRRSEFRVIRMPGYNGQGFARHLSDHLPIVITMAVDEDDD